MRTRLAYDQIVQGLSGMSAVTGTPETAPLRVGFPVCDTLGGMTAALAINGALVAPMNVTLAISPLAAAWIWSRTGGYDAVLVAIGIGAIVLCVGFWTAAVLSRRPDGKGTAGGNGG